MWSLELKLVLDESDFWVTLLPWNLKIQIVPLIFYGYYIMERAKTINPVDCLQKVNMSSSIMLASALVPLVGVSHFAPIQQSLRCQCWWQTAITAQPFSAKLVTRLRAYTVSVQVTCTLAYIFLSHKVHLSTADNQNYLSFSNDLIPPMVQFKLQLQMNLDLHALNNCLVCKLWMFKSQAFSFDV